MQSDNSLVFSFQHYELAIPSGFVVFFGQNPFERFEFRYIALDILITEFLNGIVFGVSNSGILQRCEDSSWNKSVV